MFLLFLPLIFPKVGGYLKCFFPQHSKRKCEPLTLFMYFFLHFLLNVLDEINAPPTMCCWISTCWPGKELQQLHFSHLLFLCVLQLEMEKMTRVSTISGRTMFCHLDAPANAISVCRDATQVKIGLCIFCGCSHDFLNVATFRYKEC